MYPSQYRAALASGLSKAIHTRVSNCESKLLTVNNQHHHVEYVRARIVWYLLGT